MCSSQRSGGLRFIEGVGPGILNHRPATASPGPSRREIMAASGRCLRANS